MHDDLQRLALRLGVVHSMAAQAKETAGRLADGADEYERALLKRTNKLARQIRREGVGKNPQAEQEYCQLLMQRRRMLQSYELAKKDGERMPDVEASKGLKKALRAVPFVSEPTIYLIAHCETDHDRDGNLVTGWQGIPLNEAGLRAARELAVALSSAGIEALATSDLQQAQQTAQSLHEVLGVPLAAPQSGFRPWDLGIFQGLPEKDAGPLIRRYVENSQDVAVPGGEAFSTYHERFMTALTPLLILVGKSIKNTIGVVTHSKNLLLVDAWLHSGGGIGDLDLDYYCGRDVKPGTILRLTFTPQGWEGKLIRPTVDDTTPGEALFTTTFKGRAGRKPQPGQLGLDFDEKEHPREGSGKHDGKYRGGEFVPKEEGSGKLTLWRQGDPVGRSGAGTFYTFDPARLENNPQRYEKEFHNVLDVPEEMHGPFAGNPSEALRRQWLPHLDPNKVFAAHGKDLGHKSAVDAGDWLVAHAAHERGHDAIRYEGLELQSLQDGFEPHPLFEKLHEQKTADPREEWKEKGVRSEVFKTWFGDWENNPKMASKVVDKDGTPQETHPIPVYHGTTQDFSSFDDSKLGDKTNHPTAKLGFFFSASDVVARTFAGEALRYVPEKDLNKLARELYGKDYHSITDEPTRKKLRDLEKEQPKVIQKDPMAKPTPEGSRVITAYLNMRRPYLMPLADWEAKFANPVWREENGREKVAQAVDEFKAKLTAEGHDGIILEAARKEWADERPTNEYSARSYIVFKSEQIKAADNEGTFDPTSPDIRKALADGGPFVPPDMPKWQQRPEGDESRYLPLNGVEDRDKLRHMIETMKAGEWTWDKPLIHSGDQLLTGSHRYHAAKEAGVEMPLKDFGEVCAEGGVDFEKEWRARAEPYGGWISNVSNVIRLLPAGLAEKYGIELG